MLRLLAATTIALSFLDPECTCNHEPYPDKGYHGDYPDSGAPTPSPLPPTKPGSNGACGGINEAPSCSENPWAVPSSIDELVEVIEAVYFADRWSTLYSSGDVLMRKTIEIATSDLATAPDSGSAPDWLFTIEMPSPSGVECLEVDGTNCKRVAIQGGATFRLQRIAIDGHAYVRIIRRCSAPCASDELRCFHSDSCVAKGKAFCLMCEDRGPSACACRDTACEPVLDGKMCSFVSGDAGLTNGTCLQGVCAAH